MDHEDDQDSSNSNPNENHGYDSSNLNVEYSSDIKYEKGGSIGEQRYILHQLNLYIQMKKINAMKKNIAMGNFAEGGFSKIIRMENVVV